MKKNFVIVAALLASVLSISSCKEKMDDSVLSMPETQERMDAIMGDFLEANSASNLEFITKDYVRFVTTYLNGYDMSALDSLGKVIDVISEQDDVTKDSAIEVNVVLSNLDGEIEFGESGAVFTPREGSNETVLKFALEEDQYVVNLKQLGKRSIVDFGDFYKAKNGNFPTQHGSDTTINYQEVTTVKIEIPEQLHLAVTKDGAPYASIKLTPAYSISEDGIDFTKDNVGYELDMTFGDYQLITDQTKLDFAAQTATSRGRYMKNGQELVSSTISAEVAVRSYEEELHPNNDLNTVIMPLKVKNIDLTMALMNQVEIRAHIVNAAQVFAILQTGTPALNRTDFPECVNREGWARKVAALNSMISADLYFTDNSSSQASLLFLPFYEETTEWENGENVEKIRYELQPLIVYPDGTQLTFTEAAMGFDFVPIFEFVKAWSDMIDRLSAEYVPEQD